MNQETKKMVTEKIEIKIEKKLNITKSCNHNFNFKNKIVDLKLNGVLEKNEDVKNVVKNVNVVLFLDLENCFLNIFLDVKNINVDLVYIINSFNSEINVNNNVFEQGKLNIYTLNKPVNSSKIEKTFLKNSYSEINSQERYFLKDSFYNNNCVVEHLHEKTFSLMNVKGLLNNSSSKIKGLVKINKESFDSEGNQELRALLFKNSKIIQIPDLEICNDKVKCSHAASSTRITPEDLFYLQTRCLSESESLDLVTKSFVSFNCDNKHLEKILEEKINDLILLNKNILNVLGDNSE